MDQGDDDPWTGDDDPPGGDAPPPLQPATAAGSWQLSSALYPGVDLLLPETAVATLDALRGLSENPAATLLDLAEAAGVPAVGTLRAALPDFLEEKLEGWINGEIAELTIGGVPVTEVIAALVAQIDELRTEVDLVTVLELGPVDAAGRATGRHTLEAIVFAPLGDAPVYVPASVAAVIGSSPVAATVRWSSGAGGAATLELGDHSFGLPLGTYLSAAVDELMAERFGVADLRGALGLMVDCPAIAAAVADQCVLGVCVGHEDDLLGACEGGLDEAAAQVHGRLVALDVDAIHFLAGTCSLRDDAPADGSADGLADGVWTAAMNVGLGERPVPGTFNGIRSQ